MKFVGYHFPKLIRSVAQEYLRGDGDETASTADEDKPVRATESTPRGLAVYVEPETPWSMKPRSPWAALNVDPVKLTGLSQIAFLGGTHVEASKLAKEAKRYCSIIKKPKPQLYKRLWENVRDDFEELAGTAEEFDGLLVGPHQSSDMAISYEHTRRRVVKLIENSLLKGWTKAPLIALESPSPAFSERVTRGLVDVLVPEDVPLNANFNAPQIAVPVREGQFPWWISSGNYYYCLRDNKLWYEDWMVNPLTFTTVSE